ncbi:MAG: GGDEF domain-containing protein [Butyrivibrio sp.]|nr:GGDEF domain-containing protein [Butyrivibrio sp.]
MFKRLLYLFIAFLVFLSLMGIGNYSLRPEGLSKVYVLNDGWNARYNGTEYTDIKLSDLRELIGSVTKKGDFIVLSRYISSLKYHTAPTVMFETRFSAWRISYNGIPFVESHYKNLQNGKFIGCENNFISLPAIDTRALITIELKINEDGAYNYFEPVIYGSYRDVLLYVVYNHLFVVMSSLFLIIFGLLFFFISIGFKSTITEVNTQIYSSLLYITLGVWFLAQFKLFDMFLTTYNHQTELEYISLYLAVPLMYMVIGCTQNVIRQRLFVLFALPGSIVALLPIALHLLNIGHMNQYLLLYQVDALILCAFMMALLVISIRKKKAANSQMVQLIGQTVLAFSFIFNVIFYYMELAGISRQIMLSKKAVPMGAICMVFASLINYYVYISETYAKKKENESLAHLAYADGLTNIPNRSRYEKYLNDLNESGEDYCIISIDLNGLKSVNDNQGHLMGDKYLTDFSMALEDAFRGKGFIARIGGDEFVAILRDKNILNADICIDALNKSLEDMNEKDPVISRSAAVGCAYKHETVTRSWNAAYLLADMRMYENKAKIKAGH